MQILYLALPTTILFSYIRKTLHRWFNTASIKAPNRQTWQQKSNVEFEPRSASNKLAESSGLPLLAFHRKICMRCGPCHRIDWNFCPAHTSGRYGTFYLVPSAFAVIYGRGNERVRVKRQGKWDRGKNFLLYLLNARSLRNLSGNWSGSYRARVATGFMWARTFGRILSSFGLIYGAAITKLMLMVEIGP